MTDSDTSAENPMSHVPPATESSQPPATPVQPTPQQATPPVPQGSKGKSLPGRFYILLTSSNGFFYGLFLIFYVLLRIFPPYSATNQYAIPIAYITQFISILDTLTEILIVFSFLNIFYYPFIFITRKQIMAQKILSSLFILLSLLLFLYVHSYDAQFLALPQRTFQRANNSTNAAGVAHTHVTQLSYTVDPGIAGTIVSTEKTGFFSEIYVSISVVKQVDRKNGTITGNQLAIDADQNPDGELGDAITPKQNVLSPFHYSNLNAKQLYMLTAVGSSNSAGYYGVITKCSGYIIQEYCVIHDGGSVSFLFNGENELPQPPNENTGPAIPTPQPPIIGK